MGIEVYGLKSLWLVCVCLIAPVRLFLLAHGLSGCGCYIAQRLKR